MSSSANVVAIIPARGGSKGIPGKNLASCCDRPLIDWTILAAQKSRRINHILVSSDDEGIIGHARSMGCDAPFVRPPDLATDTALVSGVIAHALNYCAAAHDYFVLLQPTSPLRTHEDIDGCIDACLLGHAPAAVSVSLARQSPYLMYRRDGTGKLAPLIEATSNRRQDLPRIYAVNGAVYVARRDWYLQSLAFFAADTVGYIMPPERAIDVDDPHDLLMAEALLRDRLSRQIAQRQ